MKVLMPFLIMFSSILASATEYPLSPSPGAAVFQGKVLEVKEVDSYTYLRLATKDGEIWAAVRKAPIKKGSKVTIENAMVMNNFESRSLKKTFEKIVFGNLQGSNDSPPGGAPIPAPMPAGTAVVNIAKASGPNARTVQEIFTKAAELKDKPVRVRGKVVKFLSGIMGRNWLHLRDGTGSDADNNNDILVTTSSETKIGDIVTVKGTVRTDKDFGSGYFYKVLIEDAGFE